MVFARRFLYFAVLIIASSQMVCASDKPNFVVILVDDLGYMDISPNNPSTFYETPHLQQMADEGLKFTNGYAANPVCSPTRYSLMTGRYPTRTGATNWFSGVREGRFRPALLNDEMPLSEVTLAEALKTAGYQTAFIGKWHLGEAESLWPEHQGFDINIAGHDRGSPPGGYFSPYKNPRLADGPEGEHLTQRLTDEAIKVLKQFHGQPFLLYLSFYTVHTPLQAPESLVEKYRLKAKTRDAVEEFGEEEQVWPVSTPRKVRQVQNHPVYAAMVESMDHSVGRVLTELKLLGLEDETLVVFTSDNGGLSTSEGSPTSNLPLRGGKGWVYEGGIREPFLMKWPQKIAAGSVSDVPICSIDLFPTVCELAGVQNAPGHQVDGQSLVPLLSGGNISDRSLYWHYPHYSNQGGFPGGAVREGKWKLVERYEDGRCHLFDLSRDSAERKDVSKNHPEITKKLRTKLHDWYQTVGARFLRTKNIDEPAWEP